jgi:hypothetical protein
VDMEISNDQKYLLISLFVVVVIAVAIVSISYGLVYNSIPSQSICTKLDRQWDRDAAPDLYSVNITRADCCDYNATSGQLEFNKTKLWMQESYVS